MDGNHARRRAFHLATPRVSLDGAWISVGVEVDAVDVAAKVALLASIGVDVLVAAVVGVLASERASSLPCLRTILAALVAVLGTVRWALRDVVPAEGSPLARRRTTAVQGVVVLARAASWDRHVWIVGIATVTFLAACHLPVATAWRTV